MAHADYNCCACCDSKMEYAAFNAETKDRLCDDCARSVSEATGKLILRSLDLKLALQDMSDADVLKLLRSVGFAPCYYENDLDKYLIERGLIETGLDRDVSKWGKRLRAA